MSQLVDEVASVREECLDDCWDESSSSPAAIEAEAVGFDWRGTITFAWALLCALLYAKMTWERKSPSGTVRERTSSPSVRVVDRVLRASRPNDSVDPVTPLHGSVGESRGLENWAEP